MPLYEYRCEACSHELEAIQKLNAPALSDCPVCGEPKLKKQISAAAFRLKGSGWYETDFKGDKKKNLHDAGGEGQQKSSNSEKPTPKTTDAKAGKETGASSKPVE